MSRKSKIAPALTLTCLVLAAAPVAAFASSPLLSGYGGPGAGAQAIIGSTLSGGSSGGAGGSSGSASVSQVAQAPRLWGPRVPLPPVARSRGDRQVARAPLRDTSGAPPARPGLPPPGPERALVGSGRMHSSIRAPCARRPPERLLLESPAGISSCSCSCSPRLAWWARQPCGFPDYSASFEQPIEATGALTAFLHRMEISRQTSSLPLTGQLPVRRDAPFPHSLQRGAFRGPLAVAAGGRRLERAAADRRSAAHVRRRDRRTRWRRRGAGVSAVRAPLLVLPPIALAACSICAGSTARACARCCSTESSRSSAPSRWARWPWRWSGYSLNGEDARTRTTGWRLGCSCCWGSVSAASRSRSPSASHAARRLVGKPVLIMGAGLVGSQVARRLDNHPEYGLAPVGFLDDDPRSIAEVGGRDVPVLGTAEDLDKIVERTGVRDLIVAFSSVADARISRLIQRCQELGIEVSVVPRMFDTDQRPRRLRHRRRAAPAHLLGRQPEGCAVRDQARHRSPVRRAAADRALAGDRARGARGARSARPVPCSSVSDESVATGPNSTSTSSARCGSTACLPSRSRPVRRSSARAGRNAPAGHRTRRRGGQRGPTHARRAHSCAAARSTSCRSLFNVLRGEMSLIGPRPERPEFVELFGRDIAPLRRPPSRQVGHHRLGTGPRAARADLARRTGRVGQLLHRPLVLGARLQDRAADDLGAVSQR